MVNASIHYLRVNEQIVISKGLALGAPVPSRKIFKKEGGGTCRRIKIFLKKFFSGASRRR